MAESPAEPKPAASGFKVPHTLVLLGGMIVLGLLLTYVLPQGAFDRVTDDGGHEQVVAGSFEELAEAEQVLLTPWEMLIAVPQGFAAAQGIIFFVFLIGGAFGVFRHTGAADALIGALLKAFGGMPFLLIAGGMAVFAVGSATIGMAEEYLPFVPMLLALCLALGYDQITAVGILCVGYGMGYGAALINPFTVIIAQDVAQVQKGSGWELRLLLWVIFLGIGIHHVWRYSHRVKQDPANSYLDEFRARPPEEKTEYPDLTLRRILVLVSVGVALVILIAGLIFAGWYTDEMGALFVGLVVVMALLAGLGASETAKQFCIGAAELTTTALLIGFARTIQVVLEKGQVIDTIIHAISQPLQAVGPYVASVGMLVVQSVCNFFIPSGSGQAYVTMPLMAPLSDLVGVDRQVAVLAYQFGDGFTNILVPTSAVLVGILAMAGVPYDRWLRFLMPLMLKVWTVAAIALMAAVALGYH